MREELGVQSVKHPIAQILELIRTGNDHRAPHRHHALGKNYYPSKAQRNAGTVNLAGYQPLHVRWGLSKPHAGNYGHEVQLLSYALLGVSIRWSGPASKLRSRPVPISSR